MNTTLTTIVSDAVQDMPITHADQPSAEQMGNRIRRMCQFGLPVTVLHSNAQDKNSIDLYESICRDNRATYIKADYNTYYGGGINLLASKVDTEFMIYVSARRGRIHRVQFIESLLSPLRASQNGMSGCLQPCNISIVTGDTDGLESTHIQGGVWAARTTVLQAVPFGNEFPQVYSDVHHGVKLRRSGYSLAAAEGIGCIPGGVIFDALKYHAISDYRSWDNLHPWRHNFSQSEWSHLGSWDGPKAFDDPRVDHFIKAFPDADKVVELGSFEGNHTCRIAKHVRDLITVEGRHENQTRAEWVKEWFDITNVTPFVADVRHWNIPACDAIHCSGLLYHLNEPVAFLKKMAAASDNLFLWTHTSDGGEANEGHDGKWMPEYGYGDMLSGLQDKSFWLTEKSLFSALESLSYNIEVIGREHVNNGNAITLKATK